MNLARQLPLSTGEVIKCVELGVYDLSKEQDIMDALYDNEVTTGENIGFEARLLDSQKPVLEAVANLYLRQQILFERI